MTKAERLEMTKELVRMLLACERFEAQDVRNKYVPQANGDKRGVALALWAAKEYVRKHHAIDFAPLHGHPDVFQRATWEKIAGRSRRQRAAGRRKEQRALERMMLAAEMAPEEAKPKLEKAADRQRLTMTMARRAHVALPGLD